MKRLLMVLLGLFLSFSLIACSSANEEEQAGGDSATEDNELVVEGELITITTKEGEVSATILVPEGWTTEIWERGDEVTISNNSGEFNFALSGALQVGVIEEKATQTEGITIDGFDLRGQVSGENNDVYEYIGVITNNYTAYIYSSTLDLTSPEIQDIIQTITFTVVN